MGLLKKKKNTTEHKPYIKGAGVCLVTRSILDKKTRLKWFFREKDGIGNGWVAFGESDTQDYVNQAQNFAIVDFDTLAHIEPAVLDVFYMPYGADLELKHDQTGTYFVDTKTGQAIREPFQNPLQKAFEKNLKFLNHKEYDVSSIQDIFSKSRIFTMGYADFPSGEIILGDPLVYLGNDKYCNHLDKTIPQGKYPIELAIIDSPIAGIRVVAVRLGINHRQVQHYEIAMSKGTTIEQYNQPGIFTGFGVDAGLACLCDYCLVSEYQNFMREWTLENQNKNLYDDYFAEFFRQSYESYPQFQREGGDFITWTIPHTKHQMMMFASGMGDGFYSGYWGLDEKGEIVELVIPFMNPEYFL